jgi:hypothetical protein
MGSQTLSPWGHRPSLHGVTDPLSMGSQTLSPWGHRPLSLGGHRSLSTGSQTPLTGGSQTPLHGVIDPLFPEIIGGATGPPHYRPQVPLFSFYLENHGPLFLHIKRGARGGPVTVASGPLASPADKRFQVSSSNADLRDKRAHPVLPRQRGDSLIFILDIHVSSSASKRIFYLCPRPYRPTQTGPQTTGRLRQRASTVKAPLRKPSARKRLRYKPA